MLIGLVDGLAVAAPVAAVAGSVAGALLSYVMNRRHTFRSAGPHRRAGSRFALVAAVAASLTYLFMSLFVTVLGAPYIPAQIVTTGLVALWTFLAHKLWTFV